MTAVANATCFADATDEQSSNHGSATVAMSLNLWGNEPLPEALDMMKCVKFFSLSWVVVINNPGCGSIERESESERERE
jgi:hypothetical protein